MKLISIKDVYSQGVVIHLAQSSRRLAAASGARIASILRPAVEWRLEERYGSKISLGVKS